MTAPDLSSLIPLKWKTWVAGVSAVLTVLVPYILQFVVYLPDPWPTVVGGVIALLGVFGVYQAPYVKPEARIAPDTQAVAEAVQQLPPPEGGYQRAWPKPQ